MLNFTRQEKIVIVFLAGAFFAGAGLLLYRHAGHPSAALASGSNAAPSAADDAARQVVRVRITGAVLHPGVYEVSPRAAAIDAVDRAVPLPDADVEALLSAAPLKDGAEIRVALKGRPGSAAGADGRVNINTATVEELDGLPGIGPRLARRIADARAAAPFEEPEDLKKVNGIGDKKYDALKDRVKTE